jgi:Protein of unknown function (DUF3800)
LTEDDVIRNQMDIFKYIKHEGFDFSKNEHTALWLLLTRLGQNPVLKDYKLPFEIYVDAGKQKPGTTQVITVLKNYAVESKITYKDSKNDVLMQFIDFIAFCINRCRWILMNDKQSESDILLLQIAEYANFNTINMQKRLLKIGEEKTSKIYDAVLRKTFDLNGNLSDEEVERRKNLREK